MLESEDTCYLRLLQCLNLFSIYTLMIFLLAGAACSLREAREVRETS